MKILFCYRYGILGGVVTQLLNRVGALSSRQGLFEAHLAFATDQGISRTLAEYPHVLFEPDPGRLRAYAKRERFDAVVVVDTEEFVEALSDLPSPLIIEVHTTVDRGLRYLGNRRWAPAGFIVPSEYSKSMLQERFGYGATERVEVVSNCLDPVLFPRVEIPRPPSRPVLAWVGKLDEHKNWRGFLEVAAATVAAGADIDVWLVGGETAPVAAEKELLQELAQAGLSVRTRWFPRIEYRAMHRMYAAVRQSGGVAVVTSRNESFAMSVLEALLCGCPVIASRVGGIPEFARDRPYLQFYELGEYRHAAELAAQVIGTGPQGEVYQTLAGERSILEDRFSPTTISERYLAVVGTMLAVGEPHRRRSKGRAESADLARPTPAAANEEWLVEVTERLRARIPGGSQMASDPRIVIEQATRLLGYRSYRMARLVATRGRGLRGLARLGYGLWRELQAGR